MNVWKINYKIDENQYDSMTVKLRLAQIKVLLEEQTRRYNERMERFKKNFNISCNIIIIIIIYQLLPFLNKILVNYFYICLFCYFFCPLC